MKPQMIVQIAVDFGMTVLLLLLMANQLTGNTAHEWLGLGMFLLWIAHHLLNIRWHTRLFQGGYTPLRAVQTAVNLLLFLSMAGTMVSAVILSREVFAFLPISGGVSLAWPMHLVCSFWGFVLMAVHLGLHWSRILAMARKAAGPSVPPAPLKRLLPLGGGVVAAYGLYALIQNQLPSYLFLVSSYVFFDFDRPFFLFFVDYLAILGLFVFLAHYGSKNLQKRAASKKR